MLQRDTVRGGDETLGWRRRGEETHSRARVVADTNNAIKCEYLEIFHDIVFHAPAVGHIKIENVCICTCAISSTVNVCF